MVKIHTCRDIPAEFAKSLKDGGVAMIDGEFTGLDIPDHDRLSLIQICGKDSKEIYLIQPNKKYETPNLVKVWTEPAWTKMYSKATGCALEPSAITG